MKSSLTDVAKAASVSVGTVSSVLNGMADARRIPKATAKRVRDTANRLGYVPNRQARSLRTRRTDTLGLLVGVSISHAYLMEIITCVEKHARAHGYSVTVGMLHDDSDAEQAMKSVEANRCDAVLAVSVMLNGRFDRQLKDLRRSGVPIVLFYCGPNPDYDCVCPDTGRSAELAVEYLLGQQRVHIACVTHDPSSLVDSEYVAGYMKALAEHGVPSDPSLVFSCPAEFDGGRDLWHAVARQDPKCNGIIAFNDDQALGLARGVQESGLRVPEDVMIVAQNNTYPVRIADAPLASTRYDLDLAAATAIQIIMDRLQDRRPHSTPPRFRLERVAPTLVGRRSS